MIEHLAKKFLQQIPIWKTGKEWLAEIHMLRLESENVIPRIKEESQDMRFLGWEENMSEQESQNLIYNASEICGNCEARKTSKCNSAIRNLCNLRRESFPGLPILFENVCDIYLEQNLQKNN